MFVGKNLITLGIKLTTGPPNRIVSIWLAMSILRSAIQKITHVKPYCLPIGFLMVRKYTRLAEDVNVVAIMIIQIVLKEHPQLINIRTVIMFVPAMAAITI